MTHKSEEEVIVNEVERPDRQREEAAPGHRSQGRARRGCCMEWCSEIRLLVTSRAGQQPQGEEGSEEKRGDKPEIITANSYLQKCLLKRNKYTEVMGSFSASF